MNFINNIFAASYKSYYNYDSYSDPRFSSIILMGAIISGIVFMLLVLIQNLFGIYTNSFFSTLPMIAYGVALFALLIKYYSAARIQSIVEKYETKTMTERKWWGFLAIVLTVLPYTILIILANKRHMR
jgi:hypothetical protein